MNGISEEQVASDRANCRAGVNQPGFKNLIAHMRRWGPDGILESAGHLPDEQYEKLAAQAKRMKWDRGTHKWQSC